MCAWECLIIDKKHFLATENTKCGYPAKYECVAGLEMHLNSTFIFIYTNSKLIIKKTRWEAGIEL